MNIVGSFRHFSREIHGITRKFSSTILYPPNIPNQLKRIVAVKFPPFTVSNCTMMPFVIGEKESLPLALRHYWSIIEACQLPNSELGKIGYVTVLESTVEKGQTVGKSGIYTERHIDSAQGKGTLDGQKVKGGLYMASNRDDTMKFWNCRVKEPGIMGNCSDLDVQLCDRNMALLKANVLVWLTDAVPYERLAQKVAGNYQYFKLVTSSIDHWYANINTWNPNVEIPKTVKIIEGDSFIKKYFNRKIFYS